MKKKLDINTIIEDIQSLKNAFGLIYDGDILKYTKLFNYPCIRLDKKGLSGKVNNFNSFPENIRRKIMQNLILV